MKFLALTSIAALTLAACGGGGGAAKAELEASCIADGEDKAACSCMADSLANTLSDDQMKMVVKLSKAEQSGEMPSAKEMEGVMELMGPMMSAAQKCDVM